MQVNNKLQFPQISSQYKKITYWYEDDYITGHTSKKLTSDKQLVLITTRETITIQYESTRKTKQKIWCVLVLATQ